MTSRQLITLRVYFLLGVTLAFISLFLDWYLLQGADNSGKLFVDWNYSLLFDWYSLSHLDTELNNWYKPENASIPIGITIFFIMLLIISSFGALCHNPEQASKLKYTNSIVLINIGVLFLILFFIVIYPTFYLFPNQLLFPLLIFYDFEVKLNFYFIVGIGYYFQIIAFICCFPYTCFYYKLAHKFELESLRDKKKSSSKIYNMVDLDRLIAEAEYLVQLKSQTLNTYDSDNVDRIYEEFRTLKSRGSKLT